MLVVVLAFVALATEAAYTHGHNGKPCCKSESEVGPWRNNVDPTKYWNCVAVQQNAISVQCPSENMFQPSTKACVHHSKWTWTAPEDPACLG